MCVCVSGLLTDLADCVPVVKVGHSCLRERERERECVCVCRLLTDLAVCLL